MKKFLIALMLAAPMMALAQTNVTTTNDRIAALKAEAEAKAKAAQEALKAAQEAEEAARLALQQAEKEAAQAEADRKAREEAERIAKEEAEAQTAIAEAERIAREAEEQAAAAKARAEEMKARAAQLKQQGTQNQTAAKVDTPTSPVATPAKAQQPSVSGTITSATKPETTNEATPLWSTTITKEEPKEAKKAEKAEMTEATNEYLAIDAVPEVDGMVRWTCDIDVPGRTAQQIYERTLDILNGIISNEKIQLERSKVAIANEQEHSIMATMQEWLVFTSNALVLDRTKFNYVLQAKCSDGHAQIILDHITYNYDQQGKVSNFKAEEWINDKYAVNKKRTRLFPNSGKFRRKTIDRKNEIFNTIKSQLK